MEILKNIVEKQTRWIKIVNTMKDEMENISNIINDKNGVINYSIIERFNKVIFTRDAFSNQLDNEINILSTNLDNKISRSIVNLLSLIKNELIMGSIKLNKQKAILLQCLRLNNEAECQYSRILLDNPNDMEILELRGDLYLTMERYTYSIHDYSVILSHVSNNHLIILKRKVAFTKLMKKLSFGINCGQIIV